MVRSSSSIKFTSRKASRVHVIRVRALLIRLTVPKSRWPASGDSGRLSINNLLTPLSRSLHAPPRSSSRLPIRDKRSRYDSILVFVLSLLLINIAIMEKSLPLQEHSQPPRQASKPRRALAGVLFPLAVAAYLLYPFSSPQWPLGSGDVSVQGPKCAQPAPLFPATGDELDRAYEHLSSESFRNGTIVRLSGAVRIPTQSFDNMGAIGEDKRWDIMYDFADYLKNTFPKVHKHLKA